VLILPDAWAWDFWTADDRERLHLFYLNAPRDLGDPELRHRFAGVGHAVSADLRTWELLPEALTAGAPGGPDDLAIWTGCVVRPGPDAPWHLLYTGATDVRGETVQSTCLATSPDLVTWTRDPANPVLRADPRWYEVLGESWPGENWRDPWVYPDPGGDGWHMLVTARSLTHGPGDDGVLAHARSHDLRHWELGPPVCESGFGFGQLEVAQVRRIEGRWVLVFTCHPQEMTAERRAATGDYCTWSVPGTSARGPWDIGLARPFTAEPDLFAAPLVQRRDGSWVLVGFLNTEPKGELNFHITDPIPVGLDEHGALTALSS